MRKILDQTGDINGQQTHRLLSLYPVPEFVKEASSKELYTDSLVPLCYADPVKRQFPVHTKAATLMSALFLWDNYTQLPAKEAATIQNEIEKKAEFFGVGLQYKALKAAFLKKAFSDPCKNLPDSDFALVIDMPDGTVERHYPLRNSLEIKAASEHLKKYQDVIPLNERQKIAQRIMEKADQLGCRLDEHEDYLDKQAGYGVCSAEDAADLLKSRSAMLKALNTGAEMRSELDKMAKLCLDNPGQVRGRESLVKLAHIVDNVDRSYDLVKEYGKRLNRPEDVLFGVTMKVAEELVSNHCESVTGNMYKIADFGKLKLDSVQEVLGEEFADNVSAGGLFVSPEKLAEQVSSLPRPEAELLDRLLIHSGIKPVAVKKASVESKLQDRDFLRSMARKR